MGTWGTGSFDNNGALDMLEEIESSDFTFDDLQWAFEDTVYLEADGGQFAIALEALIRDVQKTPGPAVPDDVDLAAFARHVTPERVDWVRAQIARTPAGDEASEFHELWRETSDFAEWLEISMPSKV